MKTQKQVKQVENDNPYFQDLIHTNVCYTDEVSENHRRLENDFLFKRLEDEFIKMGVEADNGFCYLTKEKQKRIIHQRKREARCYLTEGSFFPYEYLQLMGQIEKRVEGIYSSFIKQARKKEGLLEEFNITIEDLAKMIATSIR